MALFPPVTIVTALPPVSASIRLPVPATDPTLNVPMPPLKSKPLLTPTATVVFCGVGIGEHHGSLRDGRVATIVVAAGEHQGRRARLDQAARAR